MFDPPELASSLIISTDPAAATAGARREVLDRALLNRVNTDKTYMTEPWPPQPDSGLAIHATAAGSEENIAGSAAIPLAGRFDLEVDEADVYGRDGALDQFQCSGDHRRAWQPGE